MRCRVLPSRPSRRLAGVTAGIVSAALVITALSIPSGATTPAAATMSGPDELPAIAGLRNNDNDPGSGPLVSFGEFPRAAVDYQRRSVGLDFGTTRTVRGLRLVDNDADGATRLTAGDYTLWASDDNATYTELTGWSFDEVVDETGHVTHTFAEFETQARYVKVNTVYTDTGFTFTVDMTSGIRAYSVEPPSVGVDRSAALDIVERGLAFDDPAISAFRPAITRAPNGDILAVFNTTGDVNPGGTVDLIRSTDDGRTWGPAQVLKEPTVWEDGSIYSSRGMTTLSDGTILLPINEGVNHSPFNNRESKLFVARSSDSGHTWEGLDTPVHLPVETREHWACCNRILELDDGSLLLSLWGTKELVDDWRTDPQPWRAAVVKSYDGGHTWTDYSTIATDLNNPAAANGSRSSGVNEPSIVQLPDGRLVAMIRYGATTGFGPLAANLYVSYSNDRGATWTPPQASSLRGQTPSLSLAPCTDDLAGNAAKLIFGYRTPGNQAGISVSFDAGVTWTDEIVLQQPGPEPYIAAESDFLPLGDHQLLTLFQYRVGSGTYKLGYNVLQDAQGADCTNQLQAAEQRTEAFPTVFIERADRADWPYGVALRQRSFAASTPVADVLATSAPTVVCAGDDLYLTNAEGQRLDPADTLAEAGVRNGDVLSVHSTATGDPAIAVGHAEVDTFPQTRHVYGWASVCDYAFPLDTGARSVGLRLDVPDGQAVSSVSLRDSDGTARLVGDDYTLWVSEDNDTYTPLQVEYRYGWVDNDTDPAVGNLAHLGHTGGFALDYGKRSAGVDLGQPMTITGITVRDEDQSTRLTPGDLSLWVSDTNNGDWQHVQDVEITQQPGSFTTSGLNVTTRYLKIVQPYTDTAYTFANQLPHMLQITTTEAPRQWTFTEEVVDGRLVHTFSGLSITQPYLKIHQRYGSGTPTFVINSMRTDVNVTIDACPDGYSPSQTVAFGDQDSGVPNYERADGCTILDLIWQAAPFPDHSAFVNHVDQVTLAFVNAGLLTDHEHGRIMRAAAQHH